MMWKRALLGLLCLLVLLIVLSFFTPGGKFFWNQVAITPVLKPFSETCGYGGTAGHQINCDCDGFLFSDVKIGSTAQFCFGECGECRCYEQSWIYTPGSPEVNLTEIDCAEVSHLSWSFSNS